jgi:hypothetical protein
VWIWPTVGAILADKLSALPFAVFLMGLVTTVLLASLTYFAQTAQVRATQLARTNATLNTEISERQRTEGALRDSYQFLQIRRWRSETPPAYRNSNALLP